MLTNSVFLMFIALMAFTSDAAPKPKALIVVTSHSDLGKTGKKTGYYLPEVTHPYFALTEKGIDVDLASPQGGEAPMDENSRNLEDPANRRFLDDKALSAKLKTTLKLSEVKPEQYKAILFAGGHGTMWDFPEDKEVQRVSSSIYEKGGVVAAVCHGPAALVNIKLKNGSYLIAGKRVAGFTNDEEEAAGLTKVMPFLLENKLRERRALYSKVPNFQEHVVVDGRLVTGQNPASAAGVGEAVAKLLKGP